MSRTCAGHTPDAFRRSPRHARRGQALVEFAVVAIVLYLLAVMILLGGRMILSAQVLQQAADLGAREIARTPLPADPDISLEDVLYGNDPRLQDVRRRVFDEHYLVLKLDPAGENGNGETTFNGGYRVADLPVLNQQLFPLMILEEVGGERYLRYPGALVRDPDDGDDPVTPPDSANMLVRIPVVRTRPIGEGSGGSSGAEEFLGWVKVVEEIDTDTGPNQDPFLLTSDQLGVVALRINYPLQSSVSSGFRPRQNPSAPPTSDDPVVPVEADDGALGATPPPDAGDLITPDVPPGTYGSNPYSGKYGLGRQGAWAKEVRPFRRLMSSQAICRREVFQ